MEVRRVREAVVRDCLALAEIHRVVRARLARIMGRLALPREMLLLALLFKGVAQAAADLALRSMRGPAGLLPLVLRAARREEPRTLQIIIIRVEQVAHRATSRAALLA